MEKEELIIVHKGQLPAIVGLGCTATLACGT